MTYFPINALIHACCAYSLASLPSAQADTTVKLDRVIAVERADYGRYRIVFSITAPLPAPAGASFGPSFLLDDHDLVLAEPRDHTVLFGYAPALPDGTATLTMTGGGLINKVIQPGHLAFNPKQLLEQSYIPKGEFEPSYVLRSVGSLVDVWESWSSSAIVFTGRFLGGDRQSATGIVDHWGLIFRPDEVLHNPGHLMLGKEITFVQKLPQYLFEFGAKYIVFARKTSDSVVHSEQLAFVRVWQPKADYVVQYLKQRAAHNAIDKLNGSELLLARSFLFNALECPAAEVRFTAANELGHFLPVLGPTLEEEAHIRARASLDPSEQVRQALLCLTARGTNR